MSEQAKHFCTGCGVAAVRQCVECGEWRCNSHVTSMGWCYPGYILAGTERGAHCAGPRDHGEHRCSCQPWGAHWHRPVRLVRYVSTRGIESHGEPPVWMCASCLGTRAAWEWRWREEPETTRETSSKPDCFGKDNSAQCPQTTCPHHWTNFVGSSANSCLTAEVTRKYDGEPEPTATPRTRARILTDDGELLKILKTKSPTPAQRFSVTYCSSAPPRELVQSVIVRCGSGLVGGEPVMAPMLWTWKMKREWERHERFRLATFNDEGNVFVSTPANPVVNGEFVPPTAPDIYGGTVPLDQGVGGWRCRLCGGWLRTKEVVR